jgi:diguanylate cyclase (GGDEF)-like protein/putative nucleotidyltransferase with HDIG domain
MAANIQEMNFIWSSDQTYLTMKDFSRPTQIYILGTVIFAGLIAILQLYNSPPEGSFLLVFACLIASYLQGIAVFGTTVRSTYSLSWIVYGFTFVLMGAPATFIVVVISHLVEWLLDPDRLKWYIQTFNMSNFIIGFSLAGQIVIWGDALVGGSAIGTFLVTLAALAIFNFVNHLLVAWVLMLARGQNLAQSGVLGLFTLLLDFSLLSLGYAAAIIWQVHPIALSLIAFTTYILYQALNIPALERKTEIDPKTELFNARYFTDALNDEMVRAKRFKRPLSLIMADLDFLRTINNTYGHLAGDVVLQGIARILQEMTREYDVVARFGGEEFAIMLPETEIPDAYIVAERIRQRIAVTDFEITTSVKPIRATMSFGIAELQDGKQTIDNLIHNADVALYQAKETGRNRTCVHNGHDDVTHKTSRDWEKLGISVKETPQVSQTSSEEEQNTDILQPETLPPNPPGKETADSKQVTTEERQSSPKLPQKAFPPWATNVFITTMALLALALTVVLMRLSSLNIDWLGLIFFAGIVLVTETGAIEIYVRESTVSTSAALLIAGVFLFGYPGAIIVGFTIAFVAFAKKRMPISRFIFNASNHTMGGLVLASLLQLNQTPIREWSLIQLLIAGMLSGIIVYLLSTLLLTFAINISTGQKFKAIWMERFRWLGIYYLALGMIAAALVFSYNAIELTGILIIFLPLLMMRYSQKQYIDNTEALVHNLQKTNSQLIQKSEEITLLNEELLLTLARSLDLRDPYVMEHSKHVSRYAVCIAEEMGLSEAQVDTIRKAGLLHDIGKLGVREEILFKPSRLTAEEFELVKEHVTIGAELVRGCHTLEPLAPFVLYHHEQYDGLGYPRGLAGTEIPLEARILSLADAVEAMASDRPYKKAMSPTAIRDEIARCAGTQFDPEVAKAFSRIIERQGEEVIVNSARDVLTRQPDNSLTYEPHY